ncbi:MAG: PGF-pre-PGF domain-containing protein [Methanoregula sp.]|nr:PGF-pre-PGF domain-containing protein [Methanoregula sp.]
MPVSATPLNDALDNNVLTFTTGGDGTWSAETSVWYYGGSAAQNGSILDDQESVLETTITGPRILSFYWNVSSEEHCDYLTFYLDDNYQDQISGTNVQWTQKEYEIESGTHTAKWVYSKDESVAVGADSGWVDKVEVTAPPAPTANFTSDKSMGAAPLTIQFGDTSTDLPTSWLWNFGDVTSSSSENPVHTYSLPGRYNVTLTATNAQGSGSITRAHFASVVSEAPAISFQHSFGGTDADVANDIQKTADGGYIIAGYSESHDGDVSGNHGSIDYWIVKLTSNGVIEWQKSLGGSDEDVATSIRQTSDGGYIVAGYSASNDGNVSGNHGGYDYWIVKLSGTGAIQWQKSHGGSGDEKPYSVQQTSDGGYIVAGYSASHDGDVTGNHGGNDDWIVKLSSIGDIQWQKSHGGSGDDEAYSIRETTDGGYIIAGDSASNNGDVSGNHGEDDYWIVKLTSTGTIQWQKSLGGSDDDEAYSIWQTTDEGYIIAGYTVSSDGDVSINHSDDEFCDYWIVKLTSTGVIQWERSFGGSDDDIATSIRQTSDGGYIVAGYSASTDGDVSGNHGIADYWLVKLDSSGGAEWAKSLGGTSGDYGYAVDQNTDGSYVVAGGSYSDDGDASGNHGDYDFWIVKLAYASTSAGTDGGSGDNSGSIMVSVRPGAPAGGSVVFTFPASSSPGVVAVQTVILSPAQNIGEVQCLVQAVTSGQSVQITDRPVAGYERIEINWINPASISTAGITFSVTGAWLQDHKVAPEDIVMMRYADNQWREIPTRLDHTDGNQYYYTATTGGFSYFAITTKVKGDASQVISLSPTPTTIPTVHRSTTPVPGTPKTTIKPSQTPVPAPSHSTETGIPFITIIVGIIVLIAAVTGIILLRRWWIRRQNPALFKKYD